MAGRRWNKPQAVSVTDQKQVNNNGKRFQAIATTTTQPFGEQFNCVENWDTYFYTKIEFLSRAIQNEFHLLTLSAQGSACT